MSKIGIIIGRFQPIHNAHVKLINEAGSKVDKLIIVLGSACQAKTIKNPWNTDERKNLIMKAIDESNPSRKFDLRIISVRDYLYNDNLWLAEVQSALSSVGVDESNDVTLFGHSKDSSTYYLQLFPRMKYEEIESKGSINATDVRDLFFTKDLIKIQYIVPNCVFNYLKNEIETDGYNRLYEEYRQIQEYKESWSKSPYPVTFVTTDAIVVKSGHVLVVRRKASPGKGLIALAGGFLNPKERIIDGCIRELKEETRIAISKAELLKSVKAEKVFDHPDRSLRGRTITHAFYFDLGRGELPKVQGDDDADKAWWMPITDIFKNEESFFEDHFHILYNFLMAS